MRGIPIYAANETDFSNNGLGLLLPSECEIEEQANGMYQLRLVHPIAADLRWSLINNGCIVKAAAPVRESPLYEFTATDQVASTISVTRKVYKVDTNGSRLNLRQKPSTSSKSIARYKEGTEVIRLADNGDDWYHVTVIDGGATGYMYSEWLTYARDITETVTTMQPVSTGVGVKVQPAREQLFRIHAVSIDTERRTVTAEAMHIFYDLRGNIVNAEYKPSGVSAAVAGSHVVNHALNAHDFSLTAPNLTGTVEGDYTYKPVVEALLDPDEGIVKQGKALLVRDNFDIFLLPDEVRDRGVTIRRGKNLIGVTVTHDAADVVTRIVPVGEDVDGKPLYLDGNAYVDSPRINDYPNVYAKKIEYGVKVVKKDADPAEGTYGSNEEAREALREKAAEDFDAGCDLPSYGMEVDFVMLDGTPDYAQYAALQSVHLFDTVSVIDDVISLSAKIRVTGYVWDVLMERYVSITLGALQDLSQLVYSYNLPDGGISGNKLMQGSVSGAVFREATIGYAKIAVAAIEQLNANSITAVSAYIQKLSAGEITTDKLYAAIANITKATIQNAEIAWATIDSLQAAIAEIVSAKIDIADIDFGRIKDLDVDEAIIREGVAGELYIDRLAVTDASILSATLGKLVLKGADGLYYQVTVQADGTITTTQVTPSSGEISAGETTGGSSIVETTMNVRDLNAQSIKASSAIITEIFTDALTAGKITAAEAMLASATIPELYTTTIKAIGNNLDISANTSITLLANQMARFARLDADGLHVGDSESTGEVLIDSSTVNVVMNGRKYSQFAADYAQFGDYQMRSNSSGGLSFRPKR